MGWPIGGHRSPPPKPEPIYCPACAAQECSDARENCALKTGPVLVALKIAHLGPHAATSAEQPVADPRTLRLCVRCRYAEIEIDDPDADEAKKSAWEDE